MLNMTIYEFSDVILVPFPFNRIRLSCVYNGEEYVIQPFSREMNNGIAFFCTRSDIFSWQLDD